VTAYPANYEQVISIGAATDMGAETPESAGGKADYLFSGHDVAVETSIFGADKCPQVISGTSVATAIAAGVASLILACGRLSSYLKSSQPAAPKENLGKTGRSLQKDNIERVFKRMTVESTGNSFVESLGEAIFVLRWIHKEYQDLDWM
jgi:hypothetical protein